MNSQIFESENLKLKQASDFEDIWEYVRKIWYTQDAALKSLTGTELAGFRNIIATMVSAENNNAFSPCAIYIGLLFLASLCSGPAKKELLNAVFCDEDNALKVVEKIRKSTEGDAVISTCTMSSSLWINEQTSLLQEPIKERCKEYQVDAFSGKMGTDEMDTAIQAWVDTHAGNMLKQHTSGIKTDLSAVMELLITSYFKADWVNVFWPKSTKKDTFFLSDETKVRCDFMNGRERTRCLCGHQFTAVSKELQLDYQMWFIRPNDGVSLRNLIGSEAVSKLLASPADMPLEEIDVSMSIPKFDITSKVDMKKTMNAMGINLVFSESTTSFAEISDDPHLFLSKADHAARVKINEDGVEAASYVEFGIACAGLPPEVRRINFKLDRPFLFAITKRGKLPLYVGTVINPVE